LQSRVDSWHARGMDTLGMNTDTAEEQIAFRAALAENVASVIDSLETIGDELAFSDDRELASFFVEVAAVVRLFVSTRAVGQATFPTKSMINPSSGLFDVDVGWR